MRALVVAIAAIIAIIIGVTFMLARSEDVSPCCKAYMAYDAHGHRYCTKCRSVVHG